MRKLPCWDPNSFRSVVNIDADHVPDEVFWAVHVDVPLYLRGPEEETANRRLQLTEVVEEFLDPVRGHYQLAVHGQTGTGKSHLIHWMRQHLENYGDRTKQTVVTVRRLETNLRSILGKLIGELPADKQEGFRNELNQSGSQLSNPDAQRDTLLNNISVAIRDDEIRENSEINLELEEFFLKALPSLFYDPQLRAEKFLKEGEITDELADRLFSTKSGRREDERIEFSKEHLPLTNITAAKAAQKTRDVLDALMLDQKNTIPAALKIINRNLPKAINLSMNFSGDRLAQLLGELRAHLAEQNKELILLFEEFARFQGYDAALLEALLVQGDNEHCNIRWAIACTRGFYDGLPDTAKTRMDAIVDMDKQEQGNEDNSESVPEFAGRYLNAVRWGRENLKVAYSEHEPSESVASICHDCEIRESCHDIFGKTSNEYGLYPFTERSLGRVLHRHNERNNPDHPHLFNPREFQREILMPMLEIGGHTISEKSFPSRNLHNTYGGLSSDVSPVTQSNLRNKFEQNADRYIAVLDLWGDGVSIESSILEAFELEDLGTLPVPAPPR